MSHFCGRSPQGECGLKYDVADRVDGREGSLPARGVWIEIIKVVTQTVTGFTSLPARGVWIEITTLHHASPTRKVAPRKGSVD